MDNNRDPDIQTDWLVAFHEAVAAGCDSEFAVPPADTLPEGDFEAIRDCLRMLEQARRFGAPLLASLDSSTVEVLHEDSPKYVGRFRVIRELGRGGFGVVFLAFDPRIGRNVALKVPRPEVLAEPSTRRRFLREAEAAVALEHPNLIPIYEVGEQGLVCYIASAYCAGPNLARWLADCLKPVPIRSAAHLVGTLARGVEHAHRRGVLHRDIKPANVLLELTGEQPSAVDLSSWVPRLTDFGLAKVLERSEEETRIGSLLGTPAYMAPEQAEGRLADIGPATDVYALGVILYELVAGRPPFRCQSDVQTLQQVSRGEPLRPSRFRQRVPKDLEAITLKCLERDTARRYSSASELAEDLDRFLAGAPTRARPAGSLEKTAKWIRRRPAIASLLSVVVFASLLLAAGGWWYSGQLRVALDESRNYALESRERELETQRFLHVANVKLAEQSIASNNVQQARDLLISDAPRAQEQNLRGFAWHLLWRRVNEEELTLRGHTGDVYCVRFARNGRLMATGSQDQTARIWNRVSGQCVSVLAGHQGEVNGVAFSPDSSQLASASDDGTVKIWDVPTSAVLQRLAAHPSGVNSVAFSPDGKWLATCGREKVVRLWSTSTWEQVRLFEGHLSDVESLAFSQRGDKLATAGADHVVAVWDVATGKQTQSYKGHQSTVSSVCFDRADRQILSAGLHDHSVVLWDAATGVQSKAFGPFYGWIHAAVLVEHDQTVLVATKEGQVDQIDVQTPQVIRKLLGHAQRVWSIAASHDERQLATASADRTVKIWNLGSGNAHDSFPCAGRYLSSLAVSANGQSLVTGSQNGLVTLWDAASRRVLWQDTCYVESSTESKTNDKSHDEQLEHDEFSVSGLAISPDGNLLAASSAGTVPIVLWDARTGVRQSLPTDIDDVSQLAFAPDGRILAAVSDHGIVRFWDVQSHREQSRLVAHKGEVTRMAYSPNGKLLATSGDEGIIKIWDVLNHQQLMIFRGETPYDILALAFSPDGRSIAAAGTSRDINLWNVTTGQKKATTLVGHRGRVNSVTFSSDGRTLASGDLRGEVKLWDLATMQEIYTSLITASRRQELRIGAAEGVAEKVEGLHGTLLAAP
jgi:WD40 repeat protein/serine/threonine protein kinase